MALSAVDSSGKRYLTNTLAYEGDPVFSPDGLRIAFVSERDGNGEIYIMNQDGSDQVRLTHSVYYSSSPSFPPDGTKIVFVRRMNKNPLFWNHNEIFIVGINGS